MNRVIFIRSVFISFYMLIFTASVFYFIFLNEFIRLLLWRCCYILNENFCKLDLRQQWKNRQTVYAAHTHKQKRNTLSDRIDRTWVLRRESMTPKCLSDGWKLS